MKKLFYLLIASLSPLVYAVSQSEVYTIQDVPLPQDEVMEISAIAILPEKKIAVASRRGDIWICEGAYEENLTNVKWKKFAGGLHEPLGMFWRDDALWVTQRPELTKIKDIDHDGKGDIFQTICADWGINGDYHEYAFGSDPDRDGNVWINLCLTGSMYAASDWRGWCVRVTPEGKMIPTCSGIRSPGGIGMNAEGDMFYTDNQGTWNGSSSLKWLKPDSFQGNPVGNQYHKLANLPAPPEPKDGGRIFTERKKFPTFIPPAVIVPHGRLGHSPAGFACDLTKGEFGPWEKQLYVSEQTASEVQRISLEKVNGLYQGVVFPFLGGFSSGLVPLRQGENGMLFVGGTNRGWPSEGKKSFCFQRVKWTGKIPFEMKDVKATHDGFDIYFTQPVSDAAADKNLYTLSAWTYILQSKYGSPEVDQATPSVTAATLSPDKMKVSLSVKDRVQGHVHYIKAGDIKSSTGEKLWHRDAYYTLNEIP